MKQIVLLIVIFVLGALSYAFLNPFLLSLQKETKSEDALIAQPPTTEEESDVKDVSPVITPVAVKEDTIKITADGSLLDGPFYITDANGNATDATVEIVRSPEETLLQFKNFTQKHSSDADIYFATDKNASSFVSLGFAKLNAGVDIYGVPLDADLSMYPYILIYNVQNRQTEYFAKIN